MSRHVSIEVTEEQYATLSEIAPVVAYPDQPWSTPWRDIISITGEALGREDEANEVLAGIDASLAAAATAHPLATQTAIDVLRNGGSAIDAAIAANAMLGLVEPTGNGVGGGLNGGGSYGGGGGGGGTSSSESAASSATAEITPTCLHA